MSRAALQILQQGCLRLVQHIQEGKSAHLSLEESEPMPLFATLELQVYWLKELVRMEPLLRIVWHSFRWTREEYALLRSCDSILQPLHLQVLDWQLEPSPVDAGTVDVWSYVVPPLEMDTKNLVSLSL